ncbi:hypothetical protein SAMN06265380_10716 [Ruegeria faecimaris]|uniref:Uncharacterized protein n=1 Tax=Ruegeria faecimaris TaxID=686389 RepID=A0A521DN12_9RHOB|nr:hypothetical protein SAMN06265380_10716 [Ruegeria faecimaris]
MLCFNGFRNSQGIFKFNTKIPDRAVHLCVPQQKLEGAKHKVPYAATCIIVRFRSVDPMSQIT